MNDDVQPSWNHGWSWVISSSQCYPPSSSQVLPLVRMGLVQATTSVFLGPSQSYLHHERGHHGYFGAPSFFDKPKNRREYIWMQLGILDVFFVRRDILHIWIYICSFIIIIIPNYTFLWHKRVQLFPSQQPLCTHPPPSLRHSDTVSDKPVVLPGTLHLLMAGDVQRHAPSWKKHEKDVYSLMGSTRSNWRPMCSVFILVAICWFPNFQRSGWLTLT